MKPYEISASIVAYRDDPDEVASAIKSVLSATVRIACTVIDNSPTPALRRCVEENGATYIFAGKNLGFGGGHNLAMRKGMYGSDYHLVLNPDVHFSAEVPLALIGFMNEHPDVGLVMPKILNSDGTEQRLCKQLPSPLDLMSRRFLGGFGKILFGERLDRYEMRHVNLGVTREVPCLSGCFMFLRTKALREVGTFDERYFMYMEDVDLCRRIGAIYKTVFYPDVAITHGYAKGSYSNWRLLKYHLQSAIRYFGKWGWIFDPTRERLNQKTAPVSHDRATHEHAAYL
jgi:GT2 family glycosyltransferase